MILNAVPTKRGGWAAPALAIDVMPFVGVLLALVVTVIATAPQEIAATRIDMPPQVLCDCVYREQPIVTLVGAVVQVNDRPSTAGTLIADVCRMAGDPDGDCAGTRVSVAAAPDAAYGRVVETVGRLERAGLRVSLVEPVSEQEERRTAGLRLSSSIAGR